MELDWWSTVSLHMLGLRINVQVVPSPQGHANRRTVYNLYHILNHEVLFGGYLGQARSMIQQILRY